MQESDYSIEKLSDVFLQHAKLSDECFKVNLERFKKNYPNDELPDYMKDDFNLSKALYVLTIEINKLKGKC